MSHPTADGQPVAPVAAPATDTGHVPSHCRQDPRHGRLHPPGAHHPRHLQPVLVLRHPRGEKRHSGDGLGGALGLVLAIFVGPASPFLSSAEVGKLYERAGMPRPVSGATGLWYQPRMFILVGPLIWFVKTNGALNSYWRSQGAHA